MRDDEPTTPHDLDTMNDVFAELDDKFASCGVDEGRTKTALAIHLCELTEVHRALFNTDPTPSELYALAQAYWAADGGGEKL